MSRSSKSTPKLPPESEAAAAAAPAQPAGPPENASSAFTVIRLEDFHEIARLKADLVSVYRPANPQEMAALDRMAIAQQSILRTYRLEAGLCASAMNEFCDGRGDLTLIMNAEFVGDGDIEITHAQNRNLAFAEGFQRMVSRSDVWTVFLRYQAQAERNYRRAVEEYQRVRKLRGQLSGEPAPAPASAASPETPRAAPPFPDPRPPAPGPASEATLGRPRHPNRPAASLGRCVRALSATLLVLAAWSALSGQRALLATSAGRPPKRAHLSLLPLPRLICRSARYTAPCPLNPIFRKAPSTCSS